MLQLGEHDGDQPRRVGLQREMAEIEEQTRAADQVGGVGDVFGWLDIHLRLRFFCPAFVHYHAPLECPDTGKIFIEFVAVFATEATAQRLGLITDVVENAATVFKTANLRLHVFGLAFTGQGETGETRLGADVISGELVERDRVAEPWSPGTRRSGEEAGRGLMRKARSHAGMSQPGDDGEVVAVISEDV